jgi:hypothetical protein
MFTFASCWWNMCVNKLHASLIQNGNVNFQSVCLKLGIDTGDRLLTNSRKLKFLVQGPLPSDSVFPPFQDFDVVHNYLQTNTPTMQARLRKRGQKGELKYYINKFVRTVVAISIMVITAITTCSEFS